jgi:hypothetical protein
LSYTASQQLRHAVATLLLAQQTGSQYHRGLSRLRPVRFIAHLPVSSASAYRLTVARASRRVNRAKHIFVFEIMMSPFSLTSPIVALALNVDNT